MEILIAIIGLLLVTVIMVAVGERTGLPWPVLHTLVAAGAIFVPWIPNISIPANLILPIFIPPLLWALARRTSWQAIRSEWRTVLMLSVALVLVSAFAVGVTAYLLIPALSLAGALIIGAAIAPPDPVAVDAVAEPAGVPHRITNTLQTEGLFNDAASIVVFNLALSVLLSGQEVSPWRAVLTFLYAAGAAVLIGYLLGWGFARLHSWMSNSSTRIALTWVIPFATYIIAEEVHASGVIAIVIAAITFSSKADQMAEDRLSGTAFWHVVELLFTGVAFGLIGLSVRSAIEEVGSSLWHAVWVGVVLSVVAIAVRAAWMYGMYRFNMRKGVATGAPLRLQEVLLLTWAGMRGLVTLALVLAIPAGTSFAIYHEVSVIALTVLFFTMVLPGLTLPWLMRKLTLASAQNSFGDQEREALIRGARQAALETVQHHAQDIPHEQLEAIQSGIRGVFDVPEEFEQLTAEEKIRLYREHTLKAAVYRLEALRASQVYLLQARKHAKVDPVTVDELLMDVDRKIVIAKQRVAQAKEQVQ
ncbi:cation:proton antiporter [Corynebacterium kozikiae]|uniref:cation:proton antiporter n=1 Tax=Corynebacterium kozikiae TaxID=2968469 RepID=UPI00211CE041|nr:sodium:proton antiporter [Corynebacterium sp. 76QC2CO]MCQ9343875.1 sodium:proton antiporter [Corynebacterium sp. 76QC2CO]